MPRGLLCRTKPGARQGRLSSTAGILLGLFVSATPLAAQGIESDFGLKSVDLELLLPFNGSSEFGSASDAGARLPGFRVSLSRPLPRAGWDAQAGLVRLAPADAALWAGLVGARRAWGVGPLHLGVSAELLGGRVTGVYDRGGFREPDGDYHPLRGDTAVTVLGGGLGASVEWMAASRVALRGSVGYWRVGADEDVPRTTGFYLGAGAGLLIGSAPPAPTIGDDAPNASGILIRIVEPALIGGARSGIEAIPAGSRRVVGTVRDLRGRAVSAVLVNGQPATINPVGATGSQDEVRFLAFLPVREGTLPVEVSAETADGRSATERFTVRLTAETPETPVPQRFAVVIGVSEYDDPHVPDLDYADDDALAFYRFLRSDAAGMGGLPEENVLVLVNESANYRSMRSALFSFLRRATENDIVYVYIAAHGVPDPNRPDEMYLLPSDAEAADLPGTALPLADVNEAIAQVTARHTVFLTDACHSGGLGTLGYNARALEGNDINELFLRGLRTTEGGLAVFTAAESRQISREGVRWGGGHGAFTHHVLEALSGAADADDDHIVRLGEMMEYVRERVRRDTDNAQIPAIGGYPHDRELPMSVVLTDD